MPRKSKSESNKRRLGKTGNTDSPSYFTTLPIEAIRKLGWYDGKELNVRYSRGKIIIESPDANQEE